MKNKALLTAGALALLCLVALFVLPVITWEKAEVGTPSEDGSYVVLDWDESYTSPEGQRFSALPMGGAAHAGTPAQTGFTHYNDFNGFRTSAHEIKWGVVASGAPDGTDTEFVLTFNALYAGAAPRWVWYQWKDFDTAGKAEAAQEGGEAVTFDPADFGGASLNANQITIARTDLDGSDSLQTSVVSDLLFVWVPFDF